MTPLWLRLVLLIVWALVSVQVLIRAGWEWVTPIPEWHWACSLTLGMSALVSLGCWLLAFDTWMG